MDCPHCNEALPGDDCPACGHKALTGADFCHHCGHQLTGETLADAPALLTCTSCGHDSPEDAPYCAQCGESMGGGHDHADDYDPNERVACSDGMCVGIIGPSGKCVECGKPLSGNS